MRVSKKAGAQIVAGSRASRGRQKKIVESRKKALASLKAAKKSLFELKTKVKLAAKQFAGHMIRAEESLTRVDELGGESPYFPSKDWEEEIDSESLITDALSEVESLLETAK